MRFRPAGGLDLITGALVLGGALLVAASLVAAVVVLAPPAQPAVQPQPTPAPTPGRGLAALPPDRVATVLYVEVAAGAGSAARAGDHIDLLGYFPRQVTGTDNVTRLL